MKSTHNKIWICILAIVVLFALHACDPAPTPTYLLRATFENDFLDGHPDKTLPGDPVGDELIYGRPMVMSIVPTGYAPTHKSLDFRGGAGPISFVGKPSSFVGIMTFKWEGTVVNHWGGPPQYLGWQDVHLTDGYGHIIARLVIFGSTLYVKHKNSDPNSPVSGTALYQYLAAPEAPDYHIIEVKTSLTSGVFDLQLIADGAVHTYEDIPIYEENTSVYSTSPRPTIIFHSGSGTGSYEDGYILDNVFISKLVVVLP